MCCAAYAGRFFSAEQQAQHIFHKVFDCANRHAFVLHWKKQSLFVTRLRSHVFSTQHIIQQSLSNLAPETSTSWLPPLRTIRTSFDIKFKSSILIPTSSLMRIPVPKKVSLSQCHEPASVCDIFLSGGQSFAAFNNCQQCINFIRFKLDYRFSCTLGVSAKAATLRVILPFL